MIIWFLVYNNLYNTSLFSIGWQCAGTMAQSTRLAMESPKVENLDEVSTSPKSFGTVTRGASNTLHVALAFATLVLK